MDKRSIIGLVLIGAILFGFTWYSGRKQQEYDKQKAAADSVRLVNDIERLNSEVVAAYDEAADPLNADAGQEAQVEQHYGTDLYNASRGTERFYIVENDVMKLTLSDKGGRVATVELKDYQTYEKTPLILFPPETSRLDFSFFIRRGFGDMQINTADYYFTPVNLSGYDIVDGGDSRDASRTFAMRLNVDSVSYVEYLYTVSGSDYMIGMDVRFVNMAGILSPNQTDLNIHWASESFQDEKGFDNENNYTTLSYLFPGEKSIETLGISKGSKQENVNSRIKWVAFKHQFFTSAFIAQDAFQNGNLGYDTYPATDDRIKSYHADLAVPFSPQTPEYKFNFYFGPNKFAILKAYDLHMERLVPLGGWIVGWINRLIVIPTFDTLGRFINSYGLIIFLMTVFIKLLTSPLTYKTSLSSAKMRLLKPDIDKINEKYPKKEDAVKKQQATMELYKSAGVNPLGGCLPMLIQLPIFIALFRFFPASIELRGQSFLWADDLSSYDSILNLPFDIPLYGSHVSLFTLLMAIAMYVNSRMTYAQTANAGGQQIAGMKFMTLYMMPVMLLLWFNNYASGLSYYYLMSNLITIGQTLLFRAVINDDKLHARMKDNAKKPKKRSKWQQRYDDLLKQQQQQQKQAAKRRK